MVIVSVVALPSKQHGLSIDTNTHMDGEQPSKALDEPAAINGAAPENCSDAADIVAEASGTPEAGERASPAAVGRAKGAGGESSA